MASTIQIKRGTGTSVPSGLSDGELAINLDQRKLYFGSSSAVVTLLDSSSAGTSLATGLTGTPDITVGAIEATRLNVTSITSSIVTSSILQTEGSNIFGDTISDTHLFRGNITASGDISASGIIHAASFMTDNILSLDTSGLQGRVFSDGSITGIQIGRDGASNKNIELLGPVTASTNISASGTITGNSLAGTLATAAQTNITSVGTLGSLTVTGDITANGNIVGDGSTNITNVDTITGDGTITMSDVTIDGTLNNGVPILTFTSSQYSPVGGIAYAGGIDAGNRYALMLGGLNESLVSLCNRQHNGRVDIRANSSTAGPSGEVTASLFTHNSVQLLLPVTASGNISSTGNISASGNNYASEYYTDNYISLNTNGTQGRVFSDGSITGIQIGRNGSSDRNIELLGPVTASTNISASGTIIGDIISAGERVETSRIDHSDGVSKVSFPNGISVNGQILLASNGNITSSGNISASGDLIANGGLFLGNVSVPIISRALGVPMISSSNDLMINVDDDIFIMNNGTTWVNFQNPERKVSITGKLDVEDSVKINSHITASGNISSSGTIFANQIEADSLVSHIGDANTGLQFASDTVVVQGNNENIAVFTTNRIEFNEHITASGDISSSGILTIPSASIKQLRGDGFSANIEDYMDIKAFGNFTMGNNTTSDSHLITGRTKFSGNITSSGNISSSGTITANSITVAGDINANGNIVGDDGTSITNISEIRCDHLGADANSTTKISLENLQISAMVNDNDVFNVTEPLFTHDTPVKFSSHITASGNISASGTIIGTLGTTAQTSITSVGTLTGLTVRNTTGLINIDSSDTSVVNGQTFAKLVFRDADGGYDNNAQIRAVATEDHEDSTPAVGSKLEFRAAKKQDADGSKLMLSLDPDDGTTISDNVSITGNLKFTTDNTDNIIQQHDGNEVARIHDGGATNADTDMTSVGFGFGYKIPIMAVTADGGDKTVTLDATDSGTIIQCDADTNNIIFNLPVIDAANKAGIHFTFVVTTVVNGSKTIKINTNGTDGNDKFLLYNIQDSDQVSVDLTGDTLTIPSGTAIGTTIRLTCLTSGASNAAELWLAEAFGVANISNA